MCSGCILSVCVSTLYQHNQLQECYQQMSTLTSIRIQRIQRIGRIQEGQDGEHNSKGKAEQHKVATEDFELIIGRIGQMDMSTTNPCSWIVSFCPLYCANHSWLLCNDFKYRCKFLTNKISYNFLLWQHYRSCWRAQMQLVAGCSGTVRSWGRKLIFQLLEIWLLQSTEWSSGLSADSWAVLSAAQMY